MPLCRTLQSLSAGLALLTWHVCAGAAQAPDGFAGSYSNRFGTVGITRTADGFEVEIGTAEPRNGKWTCDFSGSGRLDGAGALVIDYRPEDGSGTIKLTLTLRHNVLSVSEARHDATADYCGMNGFIGGDYRRKAKR
jgi:hypothetical protein